MAFQLDGTKIQLASNGSSWIHEGGETNPFYQCLINNILILPKKMFL